MTEDSWVYIIGALLATGLGGGGIVGMYNSVKSRAAGVKTEERAAAHEESEDFRRYVKRLESDQFRFYVLLDYTHLLRRQMEDECRAVPHAWPEDVLRR